MLQNGDENSSFPAPRAERICAWDILKQSSIARRELCFHPAGPRHPAWHISATPRHPRCCTSSCRASWGFPSSLLLLHPHFPFSFPMSIMLWMSLTRCRCRMTKRKPTCSYLCPPAAPCSWSGTLISAVLLHGPDTQCHLWHPAGLPEIIGELGGIPMYVEKIKKFDFA